MNTLSDSDILDTFEQALREGKTITVPVSGVSMGARFAAVDAIVVSPAPVSALRSGMIIVYRRKNRWVAHRVVKMRPRGTDGMCVTKGDGVNRLDDPPVALNEYIGVVTAVRSGAETRVLGRRQRFHGLLMVALGMAKMAVASLCRPVAAAREKGAVQASDTKPRS